jgi:hypothetical protein
MRISTVFLFLLLLPAVSGAAQGTTGSDTTGSPTTAQAGGTTTAAGATAPGASTTAPAAPDPTKPDLSIPADTAKQWVVGFAVFDAAGLSPENAYLAYSIPLLLKDTVSGLTRHTFSDVERDLVRGSIIARELLTVSQSITTARKDQDALFFADTPPTDDAVKTAEARRKALIARREFLRALDPAQVDVPVEMPISFKEGTGPGKLLELPKVPADVYCRRQGLDLLVCGSIREVEGYLLVDTWAFDAVRGRVLFSSREAARRDEMYVMVPRWGKDLIGTILGRAWSVVAFDPDPPDSSLYVDGVLTASGASPALYLNPGRRDIKVTAPGYRAVSQPFTFAPGLETPLAVTLTKEVVGSVLVSSLPLGADLYLNALWQGKTPLELVKPTVRSRGVLSLPGYYDFPFSIGADSPPQLSFTLMQDTGARDIVQKRARDDFYVSFAWFALSVPLPLFCNAFALDNAVLRNDLLAQGNLSQAAAAQATAQGFLTGYYVGLAISAALFTWMVFRIIHYVSVSSGTAG